jgi:hypothetical protein
MYEECLEKLKSIPNKTLAYDYKLSKLRWKFLTPDDENENIKAAPSLFITNAITAIDNELRDKLELRSIKRRQHDDLEEIKTISSVQETVPALAVDETQLGYDMKNLNMFYRHENNFNQVFDTVEAAAVTTSARCIVQQQHSLPEIKDATLPELTPAEAGAEIADGCTEVISLVAKPPQASRSSFSAPSTGKRSSRMKAIKLPEYSNPVQFKPTRPSNEQRSNRPCSRSHVLTKAKILLAKGRGHTNQQGCLNKPNSIHLGKPVAAAQDNKRASHVINENQIQQNHLNKLDITEAFRHYLAENHYRLPSFLRQINHQNKLRHEVEENSDSKATQKKKYISPGSCQIAGERGDGSQLTKVSRPGRSFRRSHPQQFITPGVTAEKTVTGETKNEQFTSIIC